MVQAEAIDTQNFIRRTMLIHGGRHEHQRVENDYHGLYCCASKDAKMCMNWSNFTTAKMETSIGQRVEHKLQASHFREEQAVKA